MSLTFPRVAPVAVGDQITSTQLASLADAFNARLKSGIGDGAWRVAMSDFNLFRAVRNPDETGFNFPAQGEYYHLYQHLDPKYTNGATWPDADPGEPEGANLANMLNQWMFGNEYVSAESFRINEGEGVPLWLPDRVPATIEDYWELGKIQRGAVSFGDNQSYTPALSAAVSGLLLTAPYYSPMGKCYGGYFPTPEILGSCTDDFGNYPSFQIKFSALRSDVRAYSGLGSASVSGGIQTVTYSGTCQRSSIDTAVGHVWNIIRLPWAYWVLVNDGINGTWEMYLTSDWIEGPYTGGGRLARQDSGNLWRAIMDSAVAFRGTSQQRNPDTFQIEEIAFDNEAFFSRQYALSPARGQMSGAGIDAIYATASKTTGKIPENHILSFSTLGGGTAHTRAPGFVFAGFFVKAVNLSGGATVDVLGADGNPIATLELEADDTGAATTVLWLETASDTAQIQARVTSGAKFVGTGSITFQAAELAAYKPQFVDAYLLLRMASTHGGDNNGDVDSSGFDSAESKRFYTDYKELGCIVNPFTAGVRDPGAVNENPIYEAARRASRERVKILNRDPLLTYEVSGGKGIFRFKRWAFGLFNEKADQFYGLAPSFEPVTEIIEGEIYVVRATSGAVSYLGTDYAHGQKFVGTADAKFKLTGDAQPFVYDGIRSVARPKGFTNEWLFFINTHTYHWSPSSIWKLDSYGDYFTWNDHCAFAANRPPDDVNAMMNYNYALRVSERDDLTGFDTTIIGDGVLNWSTDRLPVSPELPTGYRYAQGMNTASFSLGHADASAAFCSSCRVYEPPLEIESCTIEPDMTNGGRDDVVVVTLKTRLRAHPDAPASFGTDPGAWDVTALRTEDWRSDDNAIREYIVHRDIGTHASWKIGDSAYDSDIQTWPDNPYGSIIPHFFMVRQIEKPFIDGNDVVDDKDSRAVVDTMRQMEFYLRAMCEGWMDEEATLEFTCGDSGDPFDFTYQNLCFRAFGGSQIGSFSLAVREDNPNTFGPLPSSIMRAEMFNRFASSINLLFKARLMLPSEFQVNSKNYSNNYPIMPDIGNPLCPPVAGAHMIWSGCPQDATSLDSESGFTAAGSFTASWDASMGVCFDPTDTVTPHAVMMVARTDIDFKYVGAVNYVNAIPEELASLITGNSVGVFGLITEDILNAKMAPADGTHPGATCTSGANWFFDGSGNPVWFQVSDPVTSRCAFMSAGSIHVAAPTCGDFATGTQATAGTVQTCTPGVAISTFQFGIQSPPNVALIVVPLV